MGVGGTGKVDDKQAGGQHTGGGRGGRGRRRGKGMAVPAPHMCKWSVVETQAGPGAPSLPPRAMLLLLTLVCDVDVCGVGGLDLVGADHHLRGGGLRG